VVLVIGWVVFSRGKWIWTLWFIIGGGVTSAGVCCYRNSCFVQ